ncbi:MAG TPA: tetratricopeptide repeat protein, partial [Flavisolibacter sp.]|nr:tetratricopeptide repeat protein [Flavisolibacter sp.]
TDKLDKPPYNQLTDSIYQMPKNSDLYYRRGGLLYTNNEIDEAEKDIRTAWELNPKEEYALSLTTILKKKKTDSAIVFLKKAISLIPGSLALKVGLARGYQQKNQLDSALVFCNAILQQYPNLLDALILRSDILKASNKNEEALASLEKAYSLAPLDKEIAYDLDYDYAAVKSPKALLLADILIKNDSTETVAKAYYVKATYFKNSGQISEATLNYNAAIAHDYNFLDAYLDKGELQYNSNRLAEAEKTFITALKISPTTADFYFWLGKVQEKVGRKDEAKLNYQRAYGLDKSMKEAKEAADRL